MTTESRSRRHPIEGRRTDAPWPYPALPRAAPSGPSWACPDGTCVCHAPREGPLETHHISLFDEQATRIAGARVRILWGRRLLDHEDWADDLGVVAVQVPSHVDHVTVEWAPPTLPTGSRYPFRVHYALRPEPVNGTQGIDQRLRHLGFTAFSTLRENAQDFQRSYAQPVTEDPLDIGPLLLGFHDAGALPPLARGSTLRLLEPAAIATRAAGTNSLAATRVRCRNCHAKPRHRCPHALFPARGRHHPRPPPLPWPARSCRSTRR